MTVKQILGTRRFQMFFGVLVSCVLLGWMAFTVEWSAVFLKLRAMHWWPVIPGTLLLILHYSLRAWRWRYLLPEGRSVSFAHSFDALMIGGFATYLLPLRAGEFIRPYVLSRGTSRTFASCFISVVLERFFDLAGVLITFGILLGILPRGSLPSWAFEGALSLAMLGAAILAFIVMAVCLPDLLSSLVTWGLRPVPQRMREAILKIVRDLITGASVLKSVRTITSVIFFTILVWCTGFGSFYLWLFLFDGLRSLSFGIGIGVIVALAVAAPSAPGFLGVYQVACIAAFLMFGADRETGTAFSIVTHFHQYLFIVACGLLALHRSHLHVADLTAELEKRAGKG